MAERIKIDAYIETDNDNRDKTRYSMTLYNEDGSPFSFILDIPKKDGDSETYSDQTVDVWLNDHEVMVGDTPADGFATFTPKSLF